MLSGSPHDVLGVSPSASAEAIRTAYKRRALQTHPDRTGGDTTAFRAVQAAYDALNGTNGSMHHFTERCRHQQRYAHAEEVRVSEMTVDDSEPISMLWYGCRCGDIYELPAADMQQGEQTQAVLVACRSCSLTIRVVC